MSDPLLDTLFRPTTLSPRSASAAPVRQAGTHTPAGNAMNRTRAALLDGARQAVRTSGTKLTMAQVAAAAGVAKATLYNHFRTRDAVLAALLEDEVASLIARVADRPVPEALREAATAIADSPLVRALAQREPQTLVRLARIDTTAAGWSLAREAVRGAVSAHDGDMLVLRWLSSYLCTPAAGSDVGEEVALLLAALPDAASVNARSA
jgi:AcrR family transcriptional regulator